MKIESLIWFEDVVDKINRKHGVAETEVREVFESRPRFRFVEKGHRKGENVYVALGRTNAGRYLVVFFVYKKDGRSLILSARDMTKREKKLYENK